MSSPEVHPEVLWAQRSSSSDAARNFIYLTIAAPDVPRADLKLDLQPARLTFSGKSTTKHVTYKSVMEFYEEIDPKESTVNHTDRDIELVLRKKEAKDEFWPRLLKSKAKAHWLKTNFDKWVDEEDQDPKEDEDWMAKAGGLGGEGGGLEGIDFSKFGSGPGGPGGDMPDDEEEEDEDEDEDMPALEGAGGTAEEGKAAEAAKAGIEEIE